MIERFCRFNELFCNSVITSANVSAQNEQVIQYGINNTMLFLSIYINNYFFLVKC